ERRLELGARDAARARHSATDRGHAAPGAAERASADRVARPLPGNGGAYRIRDVVVGSAAAHHGPEIELVQCEEAGAELPVGSEPGPGAGRAERLGHARDRRDRGARTA